MAPCKLSGRLSDPMDELSHVTKGNNIRENPRV